MIQHSQPSEDEQVLSICAENEWPMPSKNDAGYKCSDCGFLAGSAAGILEHFRMFYKRKTAIGPEESRLLSLVRYDERVLLVDLRRELRA